MHLTDNDSDSLNFKSLEGDSFVLIHYILVNIFQSYQDDVLCYWFELVLCNQAAADKVSCLKAHKNDCRW